MCNCAFYCYISNIPLSLQVAAELGSPERQLPINLNYHLFFYQVATDALVAMEKAMKRDSILVNDRQLACAYINSQEGQDYLAGMAAAANFAWVNRSAITFTGK